MGGLFKMSKPCGWTTKHNKYPILKRLYILNIDLHQKTIDDDRKDITIPKVCVDKKPTEICSLKCVRQENCRLGFGVVMIY